MKCPLLLPIIYQLGGLPDGNEDECKKDDCAWWDKEDNCCCIYAIPLGLLHICKWMEELIDKMPHEGQFRR